MLKSENSDLSSDTPPHELPSFFIIPTRPHHLSPLALDPELCWSELCSVTHHLSVVEVATLQVRVPTHSCGHEKHMWTEGQTLLWRTSSRDEMRAGTCSTIMLVTLYLQDLV